MRNVGTPISAFELVFVSILALTIISLAVSVYLAVSIANPSDQVKGLIETCSTTWKLGFGAIVGLIGGKAIDRGAAA